MGTNVHAFAHRLTALSMACLASAGIIFCALSGFGCSFVQIQALEGRSIGNTIGDVYENSETAYIGVQCLSSSDAPFYDADSSVDRFWYLSRIFLYVGLALGTTTTLFAWLLGSCVRPTAARWRILSILAACSAVFQIPIFLVYESDSCNFDITRQTCVLSTSAYLNVVSIFIWIVMTIWVQCLRAPRWDEELDAWRVSGNRGSSSSSTSDFSKGREMTHGKHLEETFGGVGGDQTVETMEIGGSPPRTREHSNSLPSLRVTNVGNNVDSEKQMSQHHKNEYPIHTSEAQIATKGYTETIDSSIYNTVVTVDKSVGVDTGKHAVNASQNTDVTATSSTNNRAVPGFHISCVYSDGTRKAAHFPSMVNCCIGMGDATDQTYSQVSDNFQMVELENSDSADFLVRKLRKEEKAAAARRAKRNMAPVASFEFVQNNSIENGDRRKKRNGGYCNAEINDDVSEMTRGSGWASGVSEILDDADLRHQPKAIIQDLIQKY